MPANDPPVGCTQAAGGFDIFLLPEREDLTPDQAGDSNPTGDTQDKDHLPEAATPERDQENGEQQPWKGGHDFEQARDEEVSLAAKIAGHPTQRNSNQEGDEGHRQAYGH